MGITFCRIWFLIILFTFYYCFCFHLDSALHYPYILIVDYVKKFINLLLFNTAGSVGFSAL